MLEYLYRKEFSLSYEDFRNEPFSVYITNLAIITAKRRREEREQRAHERLNNGK